MSHDNMKVVISVSNIIMQIVTIHENHKKNWMKLHFNSIEKK